MSAQRGTIIDDAPVPRAIECEKYTASLIKAQIEVCETLDCDPLISVVGLMCV